MQLFQGGPRTAERIRLADDLDVRMRRQQAAQRAARQGFVVDDHDPHGSPSRTRLATTFLSSVVFPTSLRSKW